jgi:anti-anti-sigma regulatory factor
MSSLRDNDPENGRSEPEAAAIPEPVARDIRALFERFISQETLDALPDTIGIYRTDGVLVGHNTAFSEFWKVPRDHGLIGRLNLLTAPGVAREHVQALLRAREGEVVSSPAVEIDLRNDPTFDEVQRKQLWMETVFSPLRDAEGLVRYVMLIFRDRSEDVRNQKRVSAAEETLALQRETIDALRTAHEQIRLQQDTIRELSTPIIEIWPGVVTLPVIGHVDERRAAEMTERLLASVSTLRARYVVLDLTGVEHLDKVTADHLLRILRAVPLLGGRTMIAGIHPGVAQTMVELDLDLTSVRMVRNLRSALVEIIRGDRSG